MMLRQLPGRLTLTAFLLFLLNPVLIASVIPDNQDGKRPTVGLVLSGGGAKGFAYIGLLKVIQEAGLPIDYIGGSSIGSIIGGLYAIGYHPDSIAKMIRSQNWDDLLKDVIDRKYIAYEEKEYGENTIVKLPIRNKKIGLSSSMYKGEEINLLLNHYFSPAYKITDFKKLQTPFLCIGTDLVTGEQVILDKGYLPMAIRASMSIPGYFSPTEYNGYYLVDGGVVNNYPVKEVKEMGARIIVGGDVQQGLYSTREELHTITAILDQITSFYRVNANVIGDSLTDLKVRFKLNYGMMDFESYDSLIVAGERIARAHFPQIKALADSLNAIEYRPLKEYKARPLDSIRIDSVIIRGNKRVPDHYFKAFSRDKEHSVIALKKLETDIRYLKGTGFFESVSYRIESSSASTNLVLEAREAGAGSLSAGVHYDPDYSVSLILSGVFRNVLGSNSKLFASFNLGPSPRLAATYLYSIGGMAAVGASLDFYAFKFDMYDQDVRISKVTYNNYKATLFFNYNFRNTYNLKAGFDYEYFRNREDYPSDTVTDNMQDFKSYGTFFLALAADTRDKPNFATRGFKALLRAEYVMPLSSKWAEDFFSNSAVIYLKYDHSIPLAKRFTLQPGLFAGAILENTMKPPPQHFFALGGLCPDNYVDSYVSFTGINFLQKYGYYSTVVRMKLQYNVYQRLYLTLRADGGASVRDGNELFKSKNYLFGYGVTASYDSFIGPVELSVMGSNVNPNPTLFLNIGFWF